MNMSENTALRAAAVKEAKVIFISEAHEKFYYEKLKEVRYQDAYHEALYYNVIWEVSYIKLWLQHEAQDKSEFFKKKSSGHKQRSIY